MATATPDGTTVLGAAAGEETSRRGPAARDGLDDRGHHRAQGDGSRTVAREELEQRVRAAHDELAWSNERLVAEMYERSEVEERARRVSLYDTTTTLPNRRLLESRLDEAVRNHQLAGDRLAVLSSTSTTSPNSTMRSVIASATRCCGRWPRA
jgi:PleD family two-component response regulator